MNKYLLLIVGLLLVSTYSFAMPGHGGHGCHGGHGHSGSHAHGCGHSFHYVRVGRGHYHSGRGGSGSALEYEMKGVHELNASTGTITMEDGHDTTKCYCATLPSINVNYKYFITNGVAIGISGSMQHLGGSGGNMQNANAYSFNATNTTVALDFTWLYMSHKWCQLYGSAGVGVSHYTEKDVYNDNGIRESEKNMVAMQLSLLGVRVGGRLGGFAELGFGYKGVISGGLSLQMHRL